MHHCMQTMVFYLVFLSVLQLSTFFIWKVNGCLFTEFFFPPHPFSRDFFGNSACMKKSLNPKFYFYFFSSSDIRNRSRKSVKQKIKKLWPNYAGK